ncbi:MAG: tRNA uridine-5-carboxymethylaminomethyl(34) synthesis GTPase MnmE, partial [bacterium]
MRHKGEDTIAAIATAPGIGAIGIVRISGSQAFGVAGRCFRREALFEFAAAESHKAMYGA